VGQSGCQHDLLRLNRLATSLGVGVIVGNLAIGMAFDMSQAWGLTSVWLLLLGLGLASALSIITLDERSQIDQVSLLPAKKA
jgi:hypothetical protein